MKNRHISDAGVSFENIVWSVYQELGWRTYFLLMAANYRLKSLIKRTVKRNKICYQVQVQSNFLSFDHTKT